MRDPTGYVIDDDLARAPLRDLGIEVEAVPWDLADAGWERFDLVVIRSPWDYHHRPAQFVEVLREIERRGVPLANGSDLVQWNLQKSYLRELAGRGVPTVPTLYRDRLGREDLAPLFDELGSDRIVVKPLVGLNAEGAFVLERGRVEEQAAGVAAHYAQRALLAQPFARHVLAEGEFSLFFFAGVHSHTILKTPKEGDFRVQEEHGGIIRAVVAEPALQAAAQRAMAALGEPPLYARTDFVRGEDGASFWLMELELIEPALYLRMDERAPDRFARAVAQHIAGGRGRLSTPS